MTEHDGGAPAQPTQPVHPAQPAAPAYGAPYGAPAYGEQPTQPVAPAQPYGEQPYPGQQPAVQGYPGQQYPQYGYAPTPPKNDLGVWSLVLGIVSIAMGFGLLAGIPAIIVGNKAKAAERAGLANNGSLATAGIITGWIGSALWTLFWVAYIIFIIAMIGTAASSSY